MNSVSGNFYDADILDCLLWVVFSLVTCDRKTGRQEMAAAVPRFPSPNVSACPHLQIIYTQVIRARICKPFKGPGIDSQHGGPVRWPYLMYRPARSHRVAESIPGLLKRLQIRALKYKICVQNTHFAKLYSLYNCSSVNNLTAKTEKTSHKICHLRYFYVSVRKMKA